jgi:2,3-bisphosphoglycerate-dependent phosphoglycerate mutase
MNEHDELTILLVRHAEAAPPKEGSGAESERERPLTERGLRDAEVLAVQLAAKKPDRIYSSPYRRSIQTVAPIASRQGMTVELIEDLRERLLSPEALPDWREQLQRCWRDFEYALPGGESNATAQARVVSVFEQLRRRHREGLVVVGSHGNLISLALHALEPNVDYDFWDAIPTPAVYRIEFRGRGGRIVGGPGI